MIRITAKMLKIYKPFSNLDWLNYVIKRKKSLTFHHIVKIEDGGKYEISNGALLIPLSHSYLHLIECKEHETYEALNKMFKIINLQRHEPTTEQREVIEYLLRQFEARHEEDKNSKHKKIIKPEYLQRGFYSKNTRRWNNGL